MKQLPPLNGLRAFDVAGRRLSFRAAAEELGVTQGAVAQQVRQLEAHLGVTLFDRLPKGLALTQSGRRYHSRIAAAFLELQEATADLRPEPGRVVISVTPTFAAKWLIPNLPDFSARHPDTDLRIMATEKISSFHSDGIDLAIRQGASPFGAALRAIRLFDQEIIAIASPYLPGVGQSGSAASLAGLPKIHDTHGLWAAFLAENGISDEAPRNLRLSQTALAIDAAAAGQGVALASRFLVERDLKAGRLIQIGEACLHGGQDFYLLSQRDRKSGAAIGTVTDWLVSRSPLLTT
ncbi:LysR substrate-binding domain-containing protein [uncultured Roseobacter sp.]|uniref:LysR substrate-binding domain-containing protein n=1 Tax=uncultured Roseobacter sp. TaxID=114847 RepID=UPI0026018D72|nr:LysR substrate-binding domain-containing protein [uncultured Roseobacter sp.]